MPDPVSGILAATSLGGAAIGSSSASGASKAQQAAADAGVAEQRAAREQMRQLLQPYVAAGGPALQAQLDLLGLGGSGGTPGGQVDWGAYVQGNPDALANWNAINGTSDGARFGGDINAFGQFHYNSDGSRRDLTPYTSQATAGTDAMTAQQNAIAGLESSPIFQALVRQGEEGILQNASATGGLRGGNVQGALAQFRPAMLNQQIQQRFSQLGGITQLGQNSAAGVGNAGLGAAGNIAALLEQKGAAQAGGALAQGNAWGGLLNGISSNIGMAAGIGQKFATGGF